MSELVPTPNATLTPSAGSPLDRVRELATQPAIKRALPWFLGLAAIGGAGLTYAALAPAPQRVLYSELDDTERAGVAASLDKAGITYEIDANTGTLSVAEGDLYKARMLVASDGALALPDPVSDLNNLPLGASRTLEGERLRGAREHELTLTIQQIDGVESVRVHLAEGNRSVFVRDEAPPTASVMIRMAKGRKLSDGQVAAIVNLVAGSVPGLSPDAVRVVDQHGRLLSDPAVRGSDRLEMQARMEEKLRTQLDQLLTPMLGSGNFTTEVQVELDMDEVTSARERYDKDGVVRSETSQQAQVSGQPGQAAGVPGALSNTPPPATQVTTAPPQAGPAAGAATTASGESSASRTYELGREVSVANIQPGKLKRISVAVAISQEAMKKAKPGDIDQIKALVSAAAGVDPQRGDQVQVLMRPFEPANDETLPFWEAPWFAMVVRSIVALLAVLLVLVLGVRPLIRALKRDPGQAPDSDDAGGAVQASAVQDNGADAAALGRQVSLAQRIVQEKPADAVAALQQMLGNGKVEPVR